MIANGDTTINAQARMWQGLNEYLAIDIKIQRNDSLFVEDIKVKPSRRDAKFFPVFTRFEMYSYYEDGKGTKWKRYSSDNFEQLPSENRTTNKGSSFVTYTAHYDSTKPIKFKSFSAEIEVLLRDKAGNTVTHRRIFDFYGERDCYVSAH
jgi:hypothetical protein